MAIKDLFDLSKKTAVVTGGAGGIGKQISLILAEAGANVIICSRNIDQCRNAAQYINSLGYQAEAEELDVTEEASIRRLVNKIIHKYKSIEILINASGVSDHVSATQMDVKTWENIMKTNATGTFLMSKEVGQHMIRKQYGKIINISSVAGLRGYEPENHNSVAYTSSKGAVNTLTKDLAIKWGRHGVYVNAIAPGIIFTDMNKERLKEKRKKIKKDIPLKKLGKVEDISGAILYFSSFASNHTTGQILAIDGGSSSK